MCLYIALFCESGRFSFTVNFRRSPWQLTPHFSLSCRMILIDIVKLSKEPASKARRIIRIHTRGACFAFIFLRNFFYDHVRATKNVYYILIPSNKIDEKIIIKQSGENRSNKNRAEIALRRFSDEAEGVYIYVYLCRSDKCVISTFEIRARPFRSCTVT